MLFLTTGSEDENSPKPSKLVFVDTKRGYFIRHTIYLFIVNEQLGK